MLSLLTQRKYFALFSFMRLCHFFVLYLSCPLCLLGNRNRLHRHHEYAFDYPSRIPISPTISDGLVGVLRRCNSPWTPNSSQVPHYWLSDAHGNFIIELDFSSFQIPRTGLTSWVNQRIHIRGEKIDREPHPALLRVAFIQKEENSDLSHASPAPSAEQAVCKHPSKTSPFRH